MNAHEMDWMEYAALAAGNNLANPGLHLPRAAAPGFPQLPLIIAAMMAIALLRIADISFVFPY